MIAFMSERFLDLGKNCEPNRLFLLEYVLVDRLSKYLNVLVIILIRNKFTCAVLAFKALNTHQFFFLIIYLMFIYFFKYKSFFV